MSRPDTPEVAANNVTEIQKQEPTGLGVGCSRRCRDAHEFSTAAVHTSPDPLLAPVCLHLSSPPGWGPALPLPGVTPPLKCLHLETLHTQLRKWGPPERYCSLVRQPPSRLSWEVGGTVGTRGTGQARSYPNCQLQGCHRGTQAEGSVGWGCHRPSSGAGPKAAARAGESAGFVHCLRPNGREWQVRVSPLPAQDSLTRPGAPVAAFKVAAPPAAHGKTRPGARAVIKLKGGKAVRASESVALAGLQGQRQGLTEKEGTLIKGWRLQLHAPEPSSPEPSGVEKESSSPFPDGTSSELATAKRQVPV